MHIPQTVNLALSNDKNHHEGSFHRGHQIQLRASLDLNIIIVIQNTISKNRKISIFSHLC